MKDLKDQLVGDVYELVTGEPAVVKKGAMLKDAIDAIVNKKPTTRKVYVVDEKGVLQGTITIETLMQQVGYRIGVRKPGAISFFKFLSGIFKEKVEDFMTPSVAISRKDPLLSTIKLMVENHLNDLPVVDEDGKLIGELNSLEILVESRKWFEK